MNTLLIGSGRYSSFLSASASSPSHRCTPYASNGALGSADAVEMLWETSSAGDVTESQYLDYSVSGQGWVETGNEQAFEITGSRVGDPVVPEPGTLALVLGALIAARTVRGRQSQR